MSEHLMTDACAVCEFMLAGKAKLTLVSKKTGVRFTYRVNAAKSVSAKPDFWFVSVLTGGDNEYAYTYAGVIKTGRDGLSFARTAKSKIAADAPSFRAFEWFTRFLFERETLPEGIEVYHEGACGRCGRTLTVPESIISGIGPECKKMVAAA